jgi:hypothetical protein
MGKTCSTHGDEDECQKERDHYKDQDVGGWITLKWILERQVGVVWTRFIWLRIGPL